MIVAKSWQYWTPTSPSCRCKVSGWLVVIIVLLVVVVLIVVVVIVVVVIMKNWQFEN